MNVSQCVVWQPVRALPLRYAVASNCARALEAARQLFAPWLVRPTATEEAPARFWQIVADDENADRFRLAEGNEEWRAQTLVQTLGHIEYAAVLHLTAHLPPAFIGFHGALLSRDFGGQRRGVLIVGPKEAGKSTLSCALWRAGWTLHCDDFTLLDTASRAHPTARRVSLRAGSRALLGDLWDAAAQTPSARPTIEGFAFHPHELHGEQASGQQSARSFLAPVALSAILFLNRRGVDAAPAQLMPLDGIAAAWALLPYSTLLLDESGANSTHERGDWGLGLAAVATRIADIPLFDLGRATPAAMVATIERIIASAP